MMKIDISPYILPFRTPSRKGREGALLRFDFGAGHFGFADCHPWPELGDAPLKEQLRLLKEGKTTPSTSRSLLFGAFDASARRDNRSLFADLKVPSSHYLVVDLNHDAKKTLDQGLEEGFTLIKVKVGSRFEDEISFLFFLYDQLLASGARLRLDFNSGQSEAQFRSTLKKIAPIVDLIDFFEDPIPYDPVSWQSLRQEFGIRLAADRQSLHALEHPTSCDVLVVKPAIQSAAPFLSYKREGRQVVFTSYLDHPLGQLGAALTAAEALHDDHAAVGCCGLLSQVAYVPDSFNQKLFHSKTSLVPPEGTGFGFDEELKDVPWIPLR